jgi:hypothetical protein
VRDCALPSLIPSRPGDREARGVQGRRLCRRRPRSGLPCSPTGARGSGLSLITLGHAPSIADACLRRRMRLAGQAVFASIPPVLREMRISRCEAVRRFVRAASSPLWKHHVLLQPLHSTSRAFARAVRSETSSSGAVSKAALGAECNADQVRLVGERPGIGSAGRAVHWTRGMAYMSTARATRTLVPPPDTDSTGGRDG